MYYTVGWRAMLGVGLDRRRRGGRVVLCYFIVGVGVGGSLRILHV